jgi:hypothetical protein
MEAILRQTRRIWSIITAEACSTAFVRGGIMSAQRTP